MAEKSSFFDSVNSDRLYYAKDFAMHMAKFFSNGIFNNGLLVEENENMTIAVGSGDANINGYRYTNDSQKVLTVANADGVLNRIDNVVLRLDLVNRQITAEIISGTFAETAVAPALVRSSNIYDLRIAKISVPAGTTEITAEMIEDTRFVSNDCGNVICAVTNPDFDNIYKQYEAYFKTWFQEMKDQLSSDAAGNLQLQIDNHLYNNAGAHNSIYRGKNISDLFYNGTLSQQIAAGTFDEIYIGDYIIGQTSGRKYIVAHINYRLNTGDNEHVCTTPHVLMIPEKVLTKCKMWNSSSPHTVNGAYQGSHYYNNKMSILNDCGIRSDFSNHILSYSGYLKNSITDSNSNTKEYETTGAFYNNLTFELMNEQMIFGSRMLGNRNHGTDVPNYIESDKTQLAIFKLRPDLIVAFNEENNLDVRCGWWLRNVCDKNTFVIVNDKGIPANGYTNQELGVRPAFLIF